MVALSETDQVRAAELREVLDLPGQRPMAALAFRDKHVMKTILNAGGVQVAAHKTVSSLLDVDEALSCWGTVVVKPIDGAGTVGVEMLRSRRDMIRWGEDHDPMQDEADRWIVEEYVDGPMLSVDGVVSEQKMLHAMVGRYTTTCLESVHDSVPHGVLELATDDPAALEAVGLAGQVFETLPDSKDLRSFHLECFQSAERGLVVCEVAARTGGGRISQISQRMFGIDLDWVSCLGKH